MGDENLKKNQDLIKSLMSERSALNLIGDSICLC